MAQTHSLDLEAGSSQYASITDPAAFDGLSTFTVETWLKFESIADDMMPITKWGATLATNQAWRLITASSQLQLVVGDGSATGTVTANQTLVTGVWYHVAFTWNGSLCSGSRAKAYINGKDVTSTDGTPATMLAGTADLIVGNRTGLPAGGYYDGLIKDVRIFNDVRTQAEVVTDAHTQDVSDANLVGEWNFNNAYTDSSGNGYTLTSSGSPIFVVDVPWKAPTTIESAGYVLDLESGSPQYAIAADSAALSITGDVSVEAWVKFESMPADRSDIVSKPATGGGAYGAYHIELENAASVYSLRGLTDVGGTPQVVTFTWNPPTDIWYHVAYTRNSTSGVMKLYINGKEVASSTNTTGASSDSTHDVYIGRFGSAVALPLDGSVRDIRIFNDVRTQSEITADAATSTVSDAAMVGEWSLNNAYTDTSGNGNTLTTSGSPTFKKWANNIIGALVAYYTMDETSGDRSDSHVNALTLTDNNTVLSAAGKISNAADFEATNSEYFSRADAAGLEIAGDFSFATWLNFESLPASTARMYIANRDPDDNANRVWAFALFNDGGTHKISAYNSSGGTNASTTGQVIVTLNANLSTATWYHLVVVFRSGYLEVFINGILQGTLTGLNTTMYASGTAQMSIGCYDTGVSQFFDGLMDETAIYSRGVEYGDILDLYNAGTGITYSAPVDLTVSVTDTLTVTESVTAQLINHISVADTLTVADVVGYYDELLIISESVTVELITGTSISVVDTLTVTESVIVQLIHNVSVIDRVALDEGPLASSTVITSDVLSPGTMANDSAVGTEAWSGPNNAKVSDGVYAEVTINNLDFTYTIKDTTVKIVKADGTIGTTNKGNNTSLETSDTYRTYGSTSDLWGETWTAANINDPDFGVALSYELFEINQTSYTNYLKASNFGFAVPENAVIAGIKFEVEAKGATYTIGYSKYGSVYVDHIRATVYYTAGSPQVEVQSFVSVVDTVAAAESVSPGQLSVDVSVTDTLAVTETVSVTELHDISVVDTLSVTENVTVVLTNYPLSVTDTIGVAESVTVELVNDISVIDAISITESITNSTQSSVSVIDTLAIDEAYSVLSVGATVAIFVADDIAVGEDIAFFFPLLTISVVDTLSLVEDVTNEGQVSVLIVDILSVSEDIVVEVVSFVSVTDTLAVAEDLLISNILDVFSIDTLSVAEALGQTLILGVSVIDTISVAEDVVDSIDSSISVFETLAITESITTETQSTISVTDTVSVQEVVTVELAVDVSVNDTISVSESVTLELLLNISVDETVSISEDIQTDTTAFVSVVETLSVSENLTVGIVSLISVTDALSVTESLTVESIRFSPQIPMSRPRGSGSVFAPFGSGRVFTPRGGVG